MEVTRKSTKYLNEVGKRITTNKKLQKLARFLLPITTIATIAMVLFRSDYILPYNSKTMKTTLIIFLGIYSLIGGYSAYKPVVYMGLLEGNLLFLIALAVMEHTEWVIWYLTFTFVLYMFSAVQQNINWLTRTGAISMAALPLLFLVTPEKFAN